MTQPTEIERARAHWHRAAAYPADKETVYHGHAEAHEFEAAREKDVLEYGCGGGSDTMSFLRRGARITYADIVHGNVYATSRRIAELLGPGVGGRGLPLSESARIPLPDASFDIISSHGVLHHILDPLPVLHEFRRLLRPEGRLVVMLYTHWLERRFEREIETLRARFGISREEAFAWCTDERGAPYARAYSPWEGKQLLSAGGFKLLSTYDYNVGDFRAFRALRLPEIPSPAPLPPTGDQSR